MLKASSMPRQGIRTKGINLALSVVEQLHHRASRYRWGLILAHVLKARENVLKSA